MEPWFEPRRLVRSPYVLAIVAVLALAALYGVRGGDTTKWATVGLVGTGGYLWGTWLGLRMAGRVATDVRTGASVLLLVFMLKVPPILVLAIAARNAPPEVRDGLLVGAAMVYSWLIAWGVLPEKDPARPSP